MDPKLASIPTGFPASLPASLPALKTALLRLDGSIGLQDWPTVTAALAGVGVASHLLFFICGDHNRYAHRWILRGLAGVVVLAAALLHLSGYRMGVTAVLTMMLTAAYLAGLFGSILVYRVALHPLRHFHGPGWARVSNLWHAYAIRRSDNYLVMQRLHAAYGPIVRTGPSDLSICDAAAIPVVLSNESRCVKSTWYERSLPLVNLHTVRDKRVHDARRKVFSRAFAPGALRDYEERVVVHCAELMRQMAARRGQPFDASNWFKYFAFDVMGDLGLGKEFHMMTSDENRWIPELLETSMADVGPTAPVPWIAPILHRLPWAGHGARAWLDFVGSQVAERVQKKSARKDILSYLVSEYEASAHTNRDYQWLRGDTRLTIVGGSDTTAATLTYLFYHLAQDPRQVDKLRTELEPLLAGQKTRLAPADVAKAVHLNGVIQETLRLHPAIPSGFPRLTPPEGITVGDTFVPGGMTVTLPVYALQRDPANYVRPDEFIPERWYARPDLVLNKEAFLTWNIGMNGCIGRALAIIEMRDFLTHWIQSFRSVRFASDEDGHALLYETKDHFTVGVKPLNLVFE